MADILTLALDAHQAGRAKEAERLYRMTLKGNPRSTAALNNLGALMAQQGDLKEGLKLLNASLKINPNQAQALNNKGNALRDLNRADEALSCYERAIALKADYADAFNNLGNVLRHLDRPGEALEAYDRAVALKPDYADAHGNRALALHGMGRNEEALAAAERAVGLDPAHDDAFNARGAALHALQRLDEALAAFDQAIALRPDHPAAPHHRANVLRDLGRADEALAAFDGVLALTPDDGAAHSNRAMALQALGRLDEALAGHDRALALGLDHPDVFNSRGNVLRELKRPDEALADYDRALALVPDDVLAHTNRGVVLQDLGRPDEALDAYAKAMALGPNHADSVYNRGVLLQQMNRLDEALADYDRAIALRPGYVDAHWAKASLLILKGDYEAGWPLFEWRWKKRELSQTYSGPPHWLGEQPVEGKSILLHAEQGLGDTLQMIRYAAPLAERGARVTLAVQPPLMALARTVAGAAEVISRDEIAGAFDLHAPLMSLPLAFGTRIGTIPAPGAYIAAPEPQATLWRERLGPARRPRIGLVWSGNPTHLNDHNRSLPAALLQPLLALDADFVSLQAEYRDADRAMIQGGAIADYSGQLHDFADTAGLVQQLDLVISADTSAAHLAGALGKPLWLLLPFAPDYRWGLDRSDSPWYPTARLFRQSEVGDWRPVIDAVAAEAAAFLKDAGNSAA